MGNANDTCLKQDSGGVKESPEQPTSLKHRLDDVVLGDYKIKKVIGMGYSSTVCLVEHKQSGRNFAMKIINKSIISSKNRSIVDNEKKLLELYSHPFIVNLFHTFQTKTKLYLVLEFVNGGDLYFHIKPDRRLKTEQVRLYIAEIACALNFLHKNKILFRDIKPENLLIGNDGHIKLVDFGLVKILDPQVSVTNSFVGSPYYLAPEIISGKGYGKTVDIWSLGVLMYELCCGTPPFYGGHQREVFKKIMKAKLRFPSTKRITKHEKSVMMSLLEKNPEKRMTIDQLLEHPYIVDFLKMEDVYKKKYTPLFIPGVKKDDVKYFDKKFLTMDIDEYQSDIDENKNAKKMMKFPKQEGSNEKPIEKSKPITIVSSPTGTKEKFEEVDTDDDDEKVSLGSSPFEPKHSSKNV